MFVVVKATWALLLGLLLIMVGNGLQGSLLGVRAEIESFPTQITGLVMSCYFVGILIGSIMTPRMVSSVGHIRVFAALAAIASAAVLVHSIFVDPITWGLMRLITGFSFAGLYIVVESWLNDAASNESRGELLSVYMFLSYGGTVLGQVLLNAADPAGVKLFILTSVLVSIAVVPILLTASRAPDFATPQKLDMLELYYLSPLGVAGSILVGVGMGSIFGFGAVYGKAAGLDVQSISILLSVCFIAGTLAQIPVGRISDRLDRRTIIAVCAGIAAVAGYAASIFTADKGLALFISFGVMGAFALPLYSLLIAHTNDMLDPKQMVPASGVLVMAGGIGAIVGPILSGWAMENFGASAFLVSIATIFGTTAAYTVWRMTRRAPTPEDERSTYAPVPPRATTYTSVITQRAIRDSMDQDFGKMAGPHQSRR